MDRNDQIELIKDYLEESSEFLDRYEELFLQLEQGVESGAARELIAEILNQLHTFKGNSGMMGYFSIQKYAHRLEDLFKALQSGEVGYNDSFAEYPRRSLTVLRKTIQGLSPENPDEPSLRNEIDGLEDFFSGKSRETSPAPDGTPATLREIINPFAQKTGVIKVDFKRLDHLMNLMGELVIHRTRLGRVDAGIREVLKEKGLSIELSSAVEQIGKVGTELHEAIMRVRMLPIRNVFMRFPRLVRDLARERGKEILLKFEGEDTELDKTVIDEIGEPLLHLIRNAIDHGIEVPGERLQQGKPTQGTILLRACQESSHIIITTEDDGRGINPEHLRERARRQGILSEEEAGRLNLMELIFLPGLSTAEKVTEVSGRGLGMDVVKKSLAKISGIIEVESEMGIGTRFVVKLPLTLAIISALMVEGGGERYAIPLTSVMESVRLKAEEVHLINNRPVARIRGKILPLARLGELFGPDRTGNGKNLRVVIVQSAVGQMGIVVDSLIGQQEIVIKALDDYLGAAWGIAGATILGDGKVVLIVDVPALMERFRLPRGAGETKEKTDG